ncbi:MAG: hypothetical protein HS129_04930 [Leptospiraceae bacterium]|nr:hypothetical protein [Leptospiraceae bacterium]NUM42903.1 hypothetical protein [Leptospiraceae bacterium]
MSKDFLTGKIKRYFPYDFNAEQGRKGGYGFITCEQDNTDYFFFGRDSTIHQKNIRKGIYVSFSTKEEFDTKKRINKVRACEIKRIS